MNKSELNAEYWVAVVHALAEFPVRCRIETVDDTQYSWGHPIFSPSPSYIEAPSCGPIPSRELLAIEVESVEQRRRGRLVLDLAVDHSAALRSSFQQHGIRFESTEHGFRILPPNVA